MKKKQVIKLTESDLHRIVNETVNCVLNESGVDIDDDTYYGGGLPSKYFQDEGPNEIEDFEGQASWRLIDSLLTQQGVNDIDLETKLSLIKEIAKPLSKLDKCMVLATREFYKDSNGKINNVSQNDIIKFVRESLPHYHSLLYSLKKLWIDYGWLIEMH